MCRWPQIASVQWIERTLLYDKHDGNYYLFILKQAFTKEICVENKN